MTDLSTGLYASEAIMAALLDRHKTGRGQRVQCNLLSTQVDTEFLLCHTCTSILLGYCRWRFCHTLLVIISMLAWRESDGAQDIQALFLIR